MLKAAFPKYRALVLATLVAVAVVPLTASPATAREIPPGFAVVDQYTEAFPGAGGDKKPPNGNNQSNVENFPGRTVDEFTQAGPSGVSALNLAAAGVPDSFLRGNKKDDRQEPGAAGTAGGNQSGSDPALADPPVEGSAQVAKQVFGVAGSDGMGVFLPLILVMAALLAGFYGVRSKRSTL